MNAGSHPERDHAFTPWCAWFEAWRAWRFGARGTAVALPPGMTTTNILASEILAHTIAPSAIKVGDLATFETYTRKLIGCRVCRMWAAGEISSTAQIEIQVVGDQGCYRNGMKLTVEAEIVARAL